MYEQIVESAKTPINAVFLGVTLAIFLVSISAPRARGLQGWRSRLRDIAPGLLTGIGILGTFFGIFIGLLEFDASNTDTIQRSVPALLEGMKTAFLTSVAGLFAATFVKVANAVSRPESTRRGASVGDLLEAVQDCRRTLAEEGQQLRTSLVGDGSSSVVSQLRAFRDESREGRQQIVGALNDIGKQLAESATKALIAALENAIKDFNERITEQFGSNFAQLNTAVGRLLEWQERYRDQMHEMIAHLQSSTEAARGAADALGRISGESTALVRAAESLAVLLQELARVRADLEQRLAAFADMARQAGEAMPRIEQNIAALTDGMNEQVRRAVTASSAMVEEQRQQAIAMARQYERLRSDVDGTVQSVSAQLRDVMTAFQQQGTALIVETSSRIEQAHRTEWERLRGTFTASAQQTTDHINKTFSQLDTALQQELTKALESLGGRLAAVTEAFARDFAQAIQNLRRAAGQNQP